jgi:hypothetical protein
MAPGRVVCHTPEICLGRLWEMRVLLLIGFIASCALVVYALVQRARLHRAARAGALLNETGHLVQLNSPRTTRLELPAPSSRSPRAAAPETPGQALEPARRSDAASDPPLEPFARVLDDTAPVKYKFYGFADPANSWNMSARRRAASPRPAFGRGKVPMSHGSYRRKCARRIAAGT